VGAGLGVAEPARIGEGGEVVRRGKGVGLADLAYDPEAVAERLTQTPE